MPAATLTQLVDAHAAGRDLIDKQVTALVLAAFEGFDGWYTERLVTEVSAEAYAAVLSGQRATAALTDAFLARASSAIAVTAVTGAGVALDFPLRGVDGAEVYTRVAANYRWLRSTDKGDEVARGMAMDRAMRMVSADLTQAFTAQSQRFMTRHRVDGYRRIVHPELARTGSCGLCFVAADREYHRSDLLPVHNRCRCGVLPIIDGIDPGQDLDIGAAYDEAGSTSGRDLKKVRIKVEDHSELGPQLTYAKRSARPTVESAPAKAQPKKADSLHDPAWLRNQLRVLDGMPDTDYKRQHVKRFSGLLESLPDQT